VVALVRQTSLSVLAHHDNGAGVGGLKRKCQIEENERVRIPSRVEKNSDKAGAVAGFLAQHPRIWLFRFPV